MLVAAAVCPHPPLLVPEAMGAAGGRGEGGMGEVLAACDAAVAGLKAADPDVIVVVGGADTSAAYDGTAAGGLGEYGVRFSVGTGQPVLPLSLTIGRWLLTRAGLVAAGASAGRRCGCSRWRGIPRLRCVLTWEPSWCAPGRPGGPAGHGGRFGEEGGGGPGSAGSRGGRVRR